MHSYSQILAIVALAGPSLVSAHGYVSKITSGGKAYDGTNPNWFYQPNSKPTTAGWLAKNQDNGFVEPSSFGSADIICHKEATAASASIPAAAGSSIDVQWNTWPESHKGPVITYLANCNGDCAAVKKADLKFFKIQADGLKDGSSPPGKWASDDLIANGFSAKVKIPSDIAAGNYVMRHEIIALHSAQQENGAQAYPQCVNLQITGGGSAKPSGVAGTALYKASDAGIKFNLYQATSSYPMPGPALYGSRTAKREFSA